MHVTEMQDSLPAASQSSLRGVHTSNLLLLSPLAWLHGSSGTVYFYSPTELVALCFFLT